MEFVKIYSDDCSEWDNNVLEVKTENKSDFNFGDNVECLTCGHEGIVDEDGTINI